jgi:multiple sugar transport system substrate-binding protein
VAIWVHSLGQLARVLDRQKSTVADKVAFALPPRGPAGRFPQVASHGLMIPAASRKKEPAWEFIRWATSGDTMRRIALDAQHAAVTRASVLKDPEFKKKYQLAGSDVPALHEAALRAAGAGYMAYRTVPEFPAVTERAVIALSSIAAGQKSAREAMPALNQEVIQVLEKTGHRVR